jgi:hypothetical protein
MFEFFELEKMIGADQRSSSNHSTYNRFKNCGETQKLSERLVSTGTSISREADVDGSRNEDWIPVFKGKDGRKRNALILGLTRLYYPTPIGDGNSFGATDRI